MTARVRAGTGYVTPPDPGPHHCVIPDPQPFSIGSTFECDCGAKRVMVQTPDDPSDRWDIGKRWAIA